MNYNWKIICNKLYGILKSPGHMVKKMAMFDSKGMETIDPTEATRFFVTLKSKDEDIDSYKILVALRDKGQRSTIEVKTPNLTNDTDFDCILNLVNHIKTAIGRREGIKVTWQQLDKEIDTREETMHNIKESKDIGKLSGTTKSSFQRIGDARLIVRHAVGVNEDKHGARTRHIRALFVENKNGERFSYPHLHITGARAYARHISNGGTNYDGIAKGIFKLSEDYLALRRASKEMKLHESAWLYVGKVRICMEGINKRLKSMHGPKGYANASKDLLKEDTIIDMAAIESLQKKIAESCACQQGQAGWDDYGVAAQYLNRQGEMPVVHFSWSRKPDFTNTMHDDLGQRMHNQVMELANACTNEEAANKLREVAQMLIDGSAPNEDHMAFVKEALASSMKYRQEESMIPEEKEFDQFISEFEEDKIFNENLGSTYPKVHDLSMHDDRTVYDITQTHDDIKDGDVLQLSDGRVAILYRAWPTMVIGDSDTLHTFKNDDNRDSEWQDVDDGKYIPSWKMAKSLISEDKEQDSVNALVAAGEDSSEAEKEVMDVHNESIDDEFGEYDANWHTSLDDDDSDYALGYVPNYGEIVHREGSYVLAVDTEEEHDADGQIDNVKRWHTALKDNGSDYTGGNRYEFIETLPSNPYDKTNYEAIEYFKSKFGNKDSLDIDNEINTDASKIIADEGVMDKLHRLSRKIGGEFWHGTPEEKEAERRTQDAFNRHQIEKGLKSGEFRVLDPKTGKPIDPKTGKPLENQMSEQLARLSKLAGI